MVLAQPEEDTTENVILSKIGSYATCISAV